ncbi:tyrosine-type recombinase/integrase [Aurantimonas coralicida]|uniref:tyrosine-type recombinase/integrase n=1 Tax=Aurantimonas coralicida TaxID=182270 RepID=UPI0023A33FAB|nr:tyrosine-type recombinase/integrase [Aurantimonas coralicida]MDE0922528.1 tyrosine-type recombinase/integrase [Aurantimonas coralicida]
MSDMPRPRPPFVQREVSRHGKIVWYFRRGDGPRVRLPGDFQSAEWTKAYERALTGSQEAEQRERTASGTLQWLVDRYMQSAPFLTLAPSTQRMRANVLKSVCRTGGRLKLSAITRQTMAAGRDRRASTPFAAITFLKTMSQLFDWAVDADYMATNPAKDVKRPATRSEGFRPWEDEHIIAYCEAYPIGTRERLAMDLMLFTGLARSDAIRVGRQHVRDGVIEYRREKTSAPIYIAILPPLMTSIEASPTGDMAFLVTTWGKPWGSAASFGNTFSDWCRAAGLPVRAHGLRKRIATIMAEGGASNRLLDSFFGWSSPGMAAHYTRRADARAMALKAAEGLNVNSLSPHLKPGAGMSAKNAAKSKPEN